MCLLVIQVLDSPNQLSPASKGLSAKATRQKLRKIALLHIYEYKILPSRLLLKNVRREDDKQYGSGAFSNVFCGLYDGHKVAIKQLKLFVMSSESRQRQVKQVRYCFILLRDYSLMILLLQAFHRESVIWYGLLHKNIVPFLGVSQDVIGDSLCMVLPWYGNGSLRGHLDKAYAEGRYHDTEESLKMTLTQWVSRAISYTSVHNTHHRRSFAISRWV